jgi:DNA-directed RNA polymerase specialized sigma24 family protein
VARQATAALCRIYWQPLYVYARRAGQTAHQAEDTVQGFFVHVVEHDVFARADAARGRFRTFLLAALQQFIARQHRDDGRLKRAPAAPLVSLDIESGERAVAQSPGDLSPSSAFDRAWALAQLDMAWQEIGAEFAGAGKAALYDQLRRMVGGQSGPPVRETAASLGMSEGAVNVAAHRLRRQLAEVLRKQVALTLESPDEVDDEITRLRNALSGRVG